MQIGAFGHVVAEMQGAKYLGVEMHKLNFQLAFLNLSRCLKYVHKDMKVTLVQAAAVANSLDDHTVVMAEASKAGDTWRHSASENKRKRDSITGHAPAFSVKELLGKEHYCALKMDIQGSEIDIVSLHSHVLPPYLVFEAHNQSVKRFTKICWRDMKSALQTAGYKVFVKNPSKLYKWKDSVVFARRPLRGREKKCKA